MFFDDLGQTLNSGGLDDVLTHLRALITERRPGMIAIDSFKALSAYAATPRAFRHFLHELAGVLAALPTTTFWVGEYGRDEIANAPEFAVADGIISLTTRRESERAIRHLEVLKLRGTGFMSGEHAYRIAPDGLHVFPRLAGSDPVETYELQTERMSSGIPAIDQMLVDGYWPGASTMIAGPSGSGKTLMGLHFIFNGAAAGQPGIIATLQENTTQLDRIVKGLVARQRIGRAHVPLTRGPLSRRMGLRPDRGHRADPRAPGVHRQPRGPKARANQQISVMMSQEIPALFGISTISEDGISHVSDNVLLLQFVPRDQQLRRAVTVLKTRATRHDPDVREFNITPEGIVLDEPGDHP